MAAERIVLGDSKETISRKLDAIHAEQLERIAECEAGDGHDIRWRSNPIYVAGRLKVRGTCAYCEKGFTKPYRSSKKFRDLCRTPINR